MIRFTNPMWLLVVSVVRDMDSVNVRSLLVSIIYFLINVSYNLPLAQCLFPLSSSPIPLSLPPTTYSPWSDSSTLFSFFWFPPSSPSTDSLSSLVTYRTSSLYSFGHSDRVSHLPSSHFYCLSLSLPPRSGVSRKFRLSFYAENEFTLPLGSIPNL